MAIWVFSFGKNLLRYGGLGMGHTFGFGALKITASTGVFELA